MAHRPWFQRTRAVATVLLLGATVGAMVTARAQPGGLQVKLTPNTAALTPYDVFELTFQHEREYANPFFDVTIEVTFHAPTGKTVTVGGFFYGSSTGPKIVKHTVQGSHGPQPRAEYVFDRHDLWKARFAPSGLGTRPRTAL